MYENDDREKNTVNWTTPSNDYTGQQEHSTQEGQNGNWNTASQRGASENSAAGNSFSSAGISQNPNSVDV